MIRSWLAFVLYSALMVTTYVWATYKPEAPYEVFAWAFTGGFGAYLGKRLMQKKESFGSCSGANQGPTGD